MQGEAEAEGAGLVEAEGVGEGRQPSPFHAPWLLRPRWSPDESFPWGHLGSPVY